MILQDRKNRFITTIAFLCLAIMFVLIFSGETSPFFSEPYSGDASVFLTVGKYWSKGAIPYRDLWDQKGPALYFINALGYLLTGSRCGVVIFQVIAIWFAAIYTYRIFQLHIESSQAFILTILTFASLVLNYAGNSTEEFYLPFLVVSIYFMVCWVEKVIAENIVEHAPWKAGVYGLSFAFCCLTRMTNAVGICGGVLVIVFVLLINKKFTNLFQNAGAFIAGMLLLLGPFSMYFWCKGSLYEMLYGTFIYNFEYAASSSISAITIDLLLSYFNSYALLFLGLAELLMYPKRRIAGLLWSSIGGMTSLWLFNSNGYLHYGMIALPFIAVIANELFVWSKDIAITKKSVKKISIPRLAMFLSLCVLFVTLCCGGISFAKGQYNRLFIGEVAQYEAAEKELIDLIPEEEKDSFVAYNASLGIYLRADIQPAYRFFFLQDWLASRGGSITNKIYDTFDLGKVKWIFVEGEAKVIQPIIEAKYECVAEKLKPFSENMYYRLYRIINE